MTLVQRTIEQPQLFLIVLLFAGGIAATALLVRIRFELAAPLFFAGATVGLYGVSLFGLLQIGFYLVAAYCIAGIIATVATCALPSRRDRAKELLLTPGALAFVLTGTILVFYNSVSQVSAWDDYAHWGTAVKEMVRLNDLYVRPDAGLPFARTYPPGLKLIEYVGSKMTGGFSEPALFLSLQLFSLSFILPLFATTQLKKYTQWVCLLLVFPLLILISHDGSQHLFISLYADIPMGLVFGFGLYLLLTKQYDAPLKTVLLCLVAVLLVLVKEIGLVLAGVLVIMLGLQALYEWRVSRTSLSSATHQLVSVAAVLGSIVATKMTWSWYLLNFPNRHDGDVFRSTSTIQSVVDFVLGNGQEYQYETLWRFIGSFVQTMVLRMTGTTMLMLIIVIMFAALWYQQRHKSQEKRILVGWLFVGSMVAILFYSLALLAAYLFTFAPYEAVEVVVYSRYMVTLYVAIGVFWGLTLFEHRTSKHSRFSPKQSMVLVLVVLLAGMQFFVLEFSRLKVFGREASFEEAFWAERPVLKALWDTPESSEAKVYMIATGTLGHDFYTTRYYASGIPMNEFGLYWITPRPYGGGDTGMLDRFATVMSRDEWAQLLIDEGYRYVWFGAGPDDEAYYSVSPEEHERWRHVQKEFIEEYGSLFENPDDIRPFTLFEIRPRKGGGIVLVRVG
ncbi:MAG: hypothetical protein FWG78_00865 [Coriobacteriia bacterium]|nr:hypothetical protein [Coriobacteriia bacterium]